MFVCGRAMLFENFLLWNFETEGTLDECLRVVIAREETLSICKIVKGEGG